MGNAHKPILALKISSLKSLIQTPLFVTALCQGMDKLSCVLSSDINLHGFVPKILKSLNLNMFLCRLASESNRHHLQEASLACSPEIITAGLGNCRPCLQSFLPSSCLQCCPNCVDLVSQGGPRICRWGRMRRDGFSPTRYRASNVVALCYRRSCWLPLAYRFVSKPNKLTGFLPGEL